MPDEEDPEIPNAFSIPAYTPDGQYAVINFCNARDDLETLQRAITSIRLVDYHEQVITKQGGTP